MQSDYQFDSKLSDVAEATGFTAETVHWVLSGLSPEMLKRYAEESLGHHSSAFALCRTLTLMLNDAAPGRVVSVLRECELYSSNEIGTIVYSLVDKGLVRAEPDDRQEDFANIYDLDEFDRFLDEAGIRLRRVDPILLKRRAAWLLYGIGGSIVFASHQRLVNSDIGWIGWSIAMLGWLLFHNHSHGTDA